MRTDQTDRNGGDTLKTAERSFLSPVLAVWLTSAIISAAVAQLVGWSSGRYWSPVVILALFVLRAIALRALEGLRASPRWVSKCVVGRIDFLAALCRPPHPLPRRVSVLCLLFLSAAGLFFAAFRSESGRSPSLLCGTLLLAASVKYVAVHFCSEGSALRAWMATLSTTLVGISGNYAVNATDRDNTNERILQLLADHDAKSDVGVVADVQDMLRDGSVSGETARFRICVQLRALLGSRPAYRITGYFAPADKQALRALAEGATPEQRATLLAAVGDTTELRRLDRLCEEADGSTADPDRFKKLRARGDRYWFNGDFSEASDAYLAALAVRADDPLLVVRQADCLFLGPGGPDQLRQLSDALERLERCLAELNDSGSEAVKAQVWTAMASVLLRLGTPEAGLTLAASAVELHDAAGTVVNQWWGRMVLADVLRASMHLPAAERASDEAVTLAETSEELRDWAKPCTLGLRAFIRDSRGNAAGAYDDIENALQGVVLDDPTRDAQVSYLLWTRGSVLHSLRRYEDAEADLTESIKKLASRKPLDARGIAITRATRAGVLLERGKFDEAWSDIQACVGWFDQPAGTDSEGERNPKDERNLALYLAQRAGIGLAAHRGTPIDAEADVSRAIQWAEHQPTAKRELLSEWYGLRARIHISLGELDEARADVDTGVRLAREITPAAPRVVAACLHTLAQVQLLAGNQHEALAAIDESISAERALPEPDLYNVATRLPIRARILFALQRGEDADKDLREGIRTVAVLTPPVPFLHSELRTERAKLLAALGRWSEARGEMEHAILLLTPLCEESHELRRRAGACLQSLREGREPD